MKTVVGIVAAWLVSSVFAGPAAAVEDHGLAYQVSVTTDRKSYSISSGKIVASVTLKNSSDRVLTINGPQAGGSPSTPLSVTTRPDGARELVYSRGITVLDIGQLPPGGATIPAYANALESVEFHLKKASYNGVGSGFSIAGYMYKTGLLTVGPRQERELALFVVPANFLKEKFQSQVPGDLTRGAFLMTATVHGISHEPRENAAAAPVTATGSAWIVLTP